jgi:hypothetical protein
VGLAFGKAYCSHLRARTVVQAGRKLGEQDENPCDVNITVSFELNYIKIEHIASVTYL